jgi:hypothetical protein
LERTRPVAAYANGRRLEVNALMIPRSARTLLPMRSLFQALGAEVEWNQDERSVTAWTPNGVGMRFVVGKDRAQRLSRSEQAAVSTEWRLDAPAMLIDGKVYVPVRAATEGLQAHVRWVPSEPAIYLTRGPGTDTSFAPTDQPGVEITTPRPSTPATEPTRPITPANPAVTTADAKRTIEIDGQPVRLSLDLVRDRFRLGETVPLQLTLTNTGQDRLHLRFRSGQRYEFEVLRDKALIWNWSGKQLFTQSLSTLTLAPDEDVVYNADWTQRSNADRAVPPGAYTVRGIVTAGNGNRQLVVEKQIRINR